MSSMCKSWRRSFWLRQRAHRQQHGADGQLEPTVLAAYSAVCLVQLLLAAKPGAATDFKLKLHHILTMPVALPVLLLLFLVAVSDCCFWLLLCADAGADPSSYVNEHTGYDMVQNAANLGQFEAVVKLVEAGASWRLPKGHPRVVEGAIWYVPEILSVQKQMKVSQ
jgi:phosphoglycerol transferase MdoB-like AlkP superfamily enzyme